jgi:hypothetical protein
MTAYREMTAGDKYCSQGCYDEAGRKYFAWQTAHLAGNCKFCGSSVSAGYSGYDTGKMCLIFTWQNQPMFVCGTCARAGKQKEFFTQNNKCCNCGSPL